MNDWAFAGAFGLAWGGGLRWAECVGAASLSLMAEADEPNLQGTAGGPGGTAPGGTSPEGATGTFGTDGPIPGTSTSANAHATGEDDGSGQVDMEAARRKLRDSINNVEPKPST